MDINPIEIKLYKDARRQWKEFHNAESAIQLLKKAVERNDQYADAWKLMGYIYTFQRNDADALKCWRNVCEIDPDDWEATRHYLLGISDEEDLDELRYYLKNLAPKAKPLARRYHIIGSVFKQLHCYDEALEAYCMSIEIENERKNTLNQIANVLKKTRKPELAAKFAEWAKNPRGKADLILSEVEKIV